MTISPTRLRLLVVALLLVSLLGAMDHTIVSTSLATISGELGAVAQMSWLIVAYTLSSTVALPVIGKAADLLGPRPVFLGSLVVFLLASLACGLAQNLAWIVIARAVQGVGSAGLQLMSQTIIGEVTTARERPKYLGVIGAAFPIAILVGPLLGGVITDALGWRWVFWINVPLGVVAFVAAAATVPALRGGLGRRFDLVGAAVFGVALTALVLAVTWLSGGMPPAWVAVAGIVAVIGFALLVLVETRVPEPLVPFHLFRVRAVAAALGLSVVVGVGLFAMTSYLPGYVQMVFGVTATVSGLVPIATVFGMLVSTVGSGWLVSRSGHYRPYPIVGCALGAVGFAAMAALPAGVPLWLPMAIMFVVGLGTGAFSQLVIAIVQDAAGRAAMGAATATLNLVRQVGSTIGTAVIGSVIGVRLAAVLPHGFDPATITPALVRAAAPAVRHEISAGYAGIVSPIFLVLAVVFAAGIVAALLLPAGTLSDGRAPADDDLESEARLEQERT